MRGYLFHFKVVHNLTLNYEFAVDVLRGFLSCTSQVLVSVIGREHTHVVVCLYKHNVPVIQHMLSKYNGNLLHREATDTMLSCSMQTTLII